MYTIKAAEAEVLPHADESIRSPALRPEGQYLAASHGLLRAAEARPRAQRRSTRPAAFAERGCTARRRLPPGKPDPTARMVPTKVAPSTVAACWCIPLVCDTKGDDFPADVRIRCYETLLADTTPPIESFCPHSRRHALCRPRSPIWHASAARTTLLPLHRRGRDHSRGRHLLRHVLRALIFDEFARRARHRADVLHHSFTARRAADASAKTCPHIRSTRLLPGRVRDLLATARIPATRVHAAAVAEVLI